MALSPRRAVQLGAIVALLLIGGLGFAVVRGQQHDRNELRAQLHQRAGVAARLTEDVFKASADTSYLTKSFDVPDADLPRAMRTYQGVSPEPIAFLLDGHGRVLTAYPASARARLPLVRRAIDLEATPRSLRLVANGFVLPGDQPVFMISTRFRTRYGRRVILETLPAQQLQEVVAGFLRSANGVRGGSGRLLDGNRRVMASTDPKELGKRTPTSSAHPRRDQELGPNWLSVVPVAGTSWRIELVAPLSGLYAPLQSSERTGWALLVLSAIAVLVMLALAAFARRQSGQLASTRAREAASSRLAHERLHDALTGLPNRALFLDRVTRALSSAERHKRTLAVFFVDLDRFKRVNDSLGHAIGDGLLVGAAERLQDALRPEDTISRFGGDEFLILCEELVGETDAFTIATRIHHALEAPLPVADRELHVTCSIGVAVKGPADAPVTAEALVRDADAAMYRAKERGRARLEVFDEELHAEAVRRLETEVALRHAVDAGELRVYFQPVVSLPDEAVDGVEALVRWERPGHGLVAPAEFIGVAENFGLIGPLGEWVLRAAASEVESWHRSGLVGDDFTLAVNVSAHQLSDRAFPAIVAEVVEGWSLPARALCLEITESVVSEDADAAVLVLERLQSLGVRLAIDDFGVGQSSLARVARVLPIDMIKLDRSFVAGMSQMREHAIVATAASLALAMGVPAVAEGVESADQAVELAALGFPLAQGFHFGRPAPAPAIAARLALALDHSRQAPALAEIA